MARYTLRARLEAGELADLFRGDTDASAGAVAVKVFAPKTSDPEYGKALVEVSARVAGLGHPGILGYFNVGFVENRLVAVRDHVEGYTLGQAFQRLASREAVITPEIALFVVAEAASIVGAAHAAGFAHGAITPGNVLIGFDGNVRLCDFGALEALAASPALKAFATKGRSGYRAPEIKKAGPASPTDDVYSLGSILYELITLSPVLAVRGGSLSTKRDALQPPSRVQRRVNQRVDPVVMRALDMAKARRYQDGKTLEGAIRGLFSVLGAAPSQAGVVKFAKELYPTEVKIVGEGGEMPFKGAFTVEPIANAPTLALSPVEPATDRHSFTSSDIRAIGVDDATASPEEDGAYEQASEAAETAEGSVGDSASLATDEVSTHSEDWYAPPGKMDPAVVRQKAVAEAPVPDASGPTAKEAPKERIRRPPPKEMPPSRKPVEEDPYRPPQAREASATVDDWHVPPKPPTVQVPRRQLNLGLWVGGFFFAAAAALAAYLGMKHVEQRQGATVDVKKAIDQVLGATNPDVPTYKEDLDPKPIKPPPDLRKPGSLKITSDQPAWVIVDDDNLKRKTPIPAYSVKPGKHIVRFINVKTGARIDEEVTIDEGATKSVAGRFRPKGKGR